MKSPETDSNPPFQLVAGHPALDLVNTLDWRFRDSGPEDLLKSYDDLLRFAEQSNLLSAPQPLHLRETVSSATAAGILQSSLDLREALARIFYARIDGHTPPSASLKLLESYIKTALTHRSLSWNKSHIEWQWHDTENQPELPLWLLSLAASNLITSEALPLVHACGDPACRWLFLDTSKNHTRRWCDMKICGNRMKARRFKAQRATEA